MRAAGGEKQGLVEGVNGEGRARRLYEGPVGVRMVKVAVGVEDVLDGKAVALNGSQDPLGMTTGVYDDAPLGLFAPDDVAVGLDQADGQATRIKVSSLQRSVRRAL